MSIKQSSESGTALVTAVVAAAVISTTVAGALIVTSQTSRNTQRTGMRDSAIAVGDAYLEWAFAQWRTACQAQRNSTPAAAAFDGLTTPDGTFLPDPDGFEVTNFSITALDGDGKPMPDRAHRPTLARGENSDDASYFYLASADVTVQPVGREKVTAKVRRVFEKRLESPWKYAIAYLAADRPELEIHPSPIFTVNGWVHSNGSLYASPDNGNPLQFLDRVTSVDDYFQGYVDGDWQWRGRPGPEGAPPSFDPGIPHIQDSRKDAFGIAPSQFNPTDTNQNNDSYRELLERPQPGEDALTDASGFNPRFYNAAAVRVLIDGSNNVTILNTAGNPVSATSPLAADRNLYNAVRPAITTGQNIQDNRENATVRLATVDVSQVKPSLVPGWNGVVYISDTSAGQTGGSPKRGVRLKNGATLPTGGLTVVSDNPVYIQGNYNTGATRQPSAVIGDAVMILSNAWNDANSSAGTSSRKASDTTVNTAILSGIVPTDPSYPGRQAYSGGVENFPRFLEDWSGRTFNYTGSMVQLFNSKQAIGRWGKDNVYVPPNRNWAFDTNFRTNPPPGTLFTTTYVKQRWYLE